MITKQSNLFTKPKLNNNDLLINHSVKQEQEMSSSSRRKRKSINPSRLLKEAQAIQQTCMENNSNSNNLKQELVNTIINNQNHQIKPQYKVFL